MKINIEFDSWEELTSWTESFRSGEKEKPVKAKAQKKEEKNSFAAAQEEVARIRAEAEAEAEAKPEPDPEPAMNPPEPPADTGTGAVTGATPEEQKQIEAEEKSAPSYVLADAQKAVREVVKKKGKEIAKEILGRFGHKDKEGPATGASALKPEDYAAAIAALEEALNG